jgi:hypothetical protein
MRVLPYLLVVAFIFLSSINTVHADVAHVVVPVDAEVQTAVGIIISQGETKQVRVANPKARDEHSVVVEVPYSDADRRAGALATALVSLKNGSVALADVVSLQSDFPDNSFTDLPLCDANVKLPVLSESQLGNLKRLVEIRSQRRAVLQTKMARLLQGASLEKLRKLERGFGTGTGVPLSPALLPFELVDRLSRLKQAISTYETNRQK